MRHSAFAAFSPSPARGGSSTTRSGASLAARSARNFSVVMLRHFTLCGTLFRRSAKECGEDFDGNHLIEVAGQMAGEQSCSGIEIKLQRALCRPPTTISTSLSIEITVRLEERAAADTIILTCRAVEQRVFANS